MLVHVFYMSCWFMFLTCHVSSCVLNIMFVHDSSCHINTHTHNMFITCCCIKNSYRSLNICAVLFFFATLPEQTKVRGLKGREMCFARFSCVEKIAVWQFGGSHGTSGFHLLLLTFGQKKPIKIRGFPDDMALSGGFGDDMPLWDLSSLQMQALRYCDRA